MGSGLLWLVHSESRERRGRAGGHCVSPLTLCPIANICLTSGFQFESRQNPQGFIDRNALDQVWGDLGGCWCGIMRVEMREGRAGLGLEWSPHLTCGGEFVQWWRHGGKLGQRRSKNVGGRGSRCSQEEGRSCSRGDVWRMLLLVGVVSGNTNDWTAISVL